MPKDRKGFEQVCPECRKLGIKELYEKDVTADGDLKFCKRKEIKMIDIVFLGDIVEKNGRTIRQNNLAREHKFKIGDLVNISCDGERLFVLDNTGRDCDGSPLYCLGTKDGCELTNAWGEEFMSLVELEE
jgi:hypothetical protein